MEIGNFSEFLERERVKRANECQRESESVCVWIGMALFIGGPPGELVLKAVFYRLCQVRFELGIYYYYFFL